MKITKIFSRRILNSQGSWTVETALYLEDGSFGTASVPSGISLGSHEAVFVPAEDAVSNINEIIAAEICGVDFQTQKDLDRELMLLDGTENKSRLGANAILSISIAFLKAVASSTHVPLYRYIDTVFNYASQNGSFRIPKMMVLMMEGGKHGTGKLKMQEFMQVFEDLNETVLAGKRLEDYLDEEKKLTGLGKEGAFSPDYTDRQALDVLVKVAKNPIALDVALTHKEGSDNPIEEIVGEYPVATVEDPFGEEDWREWKLFSAKFSDKIVVIADDLSVTNVKRLERIIREESANGVIVKPSQIGTVTETLEFVHLAKQNELKVVASHRGSETNDDFIADLAVGIHADFTKFGAVRCGERVAKYNRLLEIASEI